MIASAKGIVCHYNKALLPDHGENLVLYKKWVQSTMTRMGLVKRKATKAARKVPQDFPDVKVAFLYMIKDTVTMHAIPVSMIVNFDQTVRITGAMRLQCWSSFRWSLCHSW